SLRGQRRGRHGRGCLRRNRHGAPSRGAPPFGGARARRSPLHPIRPRTARLSAGETMFPPRAPFFFVVSWQLVVGLSAVTPAFGRHAHARPPERLAFQPCPPL